MKLPLGLSEELLGAMSPPSRGAWIEMLIASSVFDSGAVAPLAGGVD